MYIIHIFQLLFILISVSQSQESATEGASCGNDGPSKASSEGQIHNFQGTKAHGWISCQLIPPHPTMGRTNLEEQTMRVSAESHEEAEKLKKPGLGHYMQHQVNEDSERRRVRIERNRKRRDKWARNRPPEQMKEMSRKYKKYRNQWKKQEDSACEKKKKKWMTETEKERQTRKERMREYNAERQIKETRERNNELNNHKRKLSEEELNHTLVESHESDSSVEVIGMKSFTPSGSKTTSCGKVICSNVQFIDLSSDADTIVEDSSEDSGESPVCTKRIDMVEICELLETDEEFEEFPLVQESSVRMKEPDIDKLSMKPVVVLKRMPLEDWIAKLTVPDMLMEQSDTEESLSVESSQAESDVDIDVENESTDLGDTFKRSMNQSSAEVEQMDVQHTESSETDESVSTESSNHELHQTTSEEKFRLKPSVVVLHRIDLVKILHEITSRS